MRVLAIDFGLSRIGLAVGEVEQRIVSPRPALKASGSLKRDAQAIARVCGEEQIDLVVVGVPYQEAETSRQARICEQLAFHLKELGFEVRLIDEAMSSVEAERLLLQTGLSAAKRRRQRDGEAARIILERYLSELDEGSSR